MTKTKTATASLRRPNPRCGVCNHPRSMHGSPAGSCKAIGCVKCTQFTLARS